MQWLTKLIYGNGALAPASPSSCLQSRPHKRQRVTRTRSRPEPEFFTFSDKHQALSLSGKLAQSGTVPRTKKDNSNGGAAKSSKDATRQQSSTSTREPMAPKRCVVNVGAPQPAAKLAL
jgi:hypothetical protein